MKSEIISEEEIKELQERFKQVSRRKDSFSIVILRRVLESHEILRSITGAKEDLSTK